MHTYAAYDHGVIWGSGDTEQAAREDATVWLGHRHNGHLLLSTDDLQVAPMTLRLQVALHEHGVGKGFVLRDDGQLDMRRPVHRPVVYPQPM